MGEFEVPAAAYYGANTMRAKVNFPISDLRLPRGFIRAIGLIKQQSAMVNRELGLLDENIAGAIIRAAQDVVDGALDGEFIVDVFQTGSGTSTNMNANEVIANRAIELLGGERGSRTPVHPERPREPRAVEQRRDPDGDPGRGRGGDPRGPDPGAARPRGVAAAQVGGVLAGRQDRAHPPPGCDADPARSGVPRLRGTGRACPPPLRGGDRDARRAAARRHRRRDRSRHPSGVPGEGDRSHRSRPRHSVSRDRQPLQRAVDARRRGVGQRCAPRGCGRPLQDRQRHPAARLRSACGHRRDLDSRRSSRGRRSCPAR